MNKIMSLPIHYPGNVSSTYRINKLDNLKKAYHF